MAWHLMSRRNPLSRLMRSGKRQTMTVGPTGRPHRDRRAAGQAAGTVLAAPPGRTANADGTRQPYRMHSAADVGYPPLAEAPGRYVLQR